METYGCDSPLGAWRVLFQLPRPAPQAEPRHGRSRATVSRAQPAVSSRLLLQRTGGGAAREPGTVVVLERRVSRAEKSRVADRVSAAGRRGRAEKRGGRRQAGTTGF